MHRAAERTARYACRAPAAYRGQAPPGQGRAPPSALRRRARCARRAVLPHAPPTLARAPRGGSAGQTGPHVSRLRRAAFRTPGQESGAGAPRWRSRRASRLARRMSRAASASMRACSASRAAAAAPRRRSAAPAAAAASARHAARAAASSAAAAAACAARLCAGRAGRWQPHSRAGRE